MDVTVGSCNAKANGGAGWAKEHAPTHTEQQAASTLHTDDTASTSLDELVIALRRAWLCDSSLQPRRLCLLVQLGASVQWQSAQFDIRSLAGRGCCKPFIPLADKMGAPWEPGNFPRTRSCPSLHLESGTTLATLDRFWTVAIRNILCSWGQEAKERRVWSRIRASPLSWDLLGSLAPLHGIRLASDPVPRALRCGPDKSFSRVVSRSGPDAPTLELCSPPHFPRLRRLSPSNPRILSVWLPRSLLGSLEAVHNQHASMKLQSLLRALGASVQDAEEGGRTDRTSLVLLTTQEGIWAASHPGQLTHLGVIFRDI